MESQSQFSDPAAFLRLTPANLYAKIAFNDVVLLMNASRSNAHLQHARKFMEVQPYQHEIEISSRTCASRWRIFRNPTLNLMYLARESL